MAYAQAQLQGMVDNDRMGGTVRWASAPLVNDVPKKEGMFPLAKGLTWLYSISRGGSSLGANVTRLDPGYGGGANAIVQQQYADRCILSKEAVLSLIELGCYLHTTCSSAPFTNGEEIWTYLNSAGVVYVRPDDDEAAQHIRTVQGWTYEDLDTSKQCKTRQGSMLAFQSENSEPQPSNAPKYEHQ